MAKPPATAAAALYPPPYRLLYNRTHVRGRCTVARTTVLHIRWLDGFPEIIRENKKLLLLVLLLFHFAHWLKEQAPLSSLATTAAVEAAEAIVRRRNERVAGCFFSACWEDVKVRLEFAPCTYVVKACERGLQVKLCNFTVGLYGQ